jgi:hypothetical protein
MFTVWVWETRTERISDTVAWFPKTTIVPTVTAMDIIAAALTDIKVALQKFPTDENLSTLSGGEREILTKLQSLFDDDESDDASALRVVNNDTEAEASGESSQRVTSSVESEPTVIRAIEHETDDRHVRFAPLPEPHTATYQYSTGAPGRVKRKSKRENKTLYPSPQKSELYKPVPHEHGTRAATRNRINNNGAANTVIPNHDNDDQSLQYALHGNAFNPDTNLPAEYDELRQSSVGSVWIKAFKEEMLRLLNTETIKFIKVSNIPRGIKPTYARIVCAFRPEKEKPNRVRLTIGGDRVVYSGDVSTKTADMATVKILINSVLSTPGAMFMSIDIKDFYLNTPMNPTDYAYMRIPAKLIPDDIMEQYNVQSSIHNGNAYVEVRKGMYGLPQAGRLANDQLVQHLATYGYTPCPITPGLWRHESRHIMFTLVVDDFGIQYETKTDVEHLMNALRSLYKISEDWSGMRYCGLTLNWDYDGRTCDISMPGYIERALQRFQHDGPTRPQHSPHAWQKPEFGASTQYAPDPDHTPLLDLSDTKRVQEILGTLLYYARAVDPTLLVAIGSLAQQQAKPTMATMKGIVQLLDYCATHPDSVVRFIASDMILHVESDASYLSEPKATSRAAGYHYLSSRLPNDQIAPDPDDPSPPFNGPVNIFCQVLKEVVSSAAEAELAGLFHNGKEACPLRIALEEMGYPQPPTPIVTDNSTASGIANDTVKQKRSKAIDMRFYWIRDRVRQKQFIVYWRKGSRNRGDYFTKHHPTSHHVDMRPIYLHTANVSIPTSNYYSMLDDFEEEDIDSENETSDFPVVSSPGIGEGVLMSSSGLSPSLTSLYPIPCDSQHESTMIIPSQAAMIPLASPTLSLQMPVHNYSHLAHKLCSSP